MRPSWTLDGKAIWAGRRPPLAAYDATTGAVKVALARRAHREVGAHGRAPGRSLVTAFPPPGASVHRQGDALMQPTARRLVALPGALQEALAVTSDGQHGSVAQVTRTGPS